jgi:hypothetical protein
MPEACQTDYRRNPKRYNSAIEQRCSPYWKVADISPEPSLLVSGKMRDQLAHLTGIYALEDNR